MGFDVDGARKAGYSPAEIADFLGQSKNFDVAGARKAGYSDDEIIGHLSPAEPGVVSQTVSGTADALGVGSGNTVRSVGQVLGATPEGTAGTGLNILGSITKAAGRLAGTLSTNPDFASGDVAQTQPQADQLGARMQAGTEQFVAQNITPKANELLAAGRKRVADTLANEPNSGEAARYRVGQSLEDVGQRAQQYYSQEMQQDAPEMVRQAQAIQDANGFTGTLKAAAQNPLGVVNMVGESAPDMVIGAGLGKIAASTVFRSGAVREAAQAAGEKAFQETLLSAASNPTTLPKARKLAQAARQEAVDTYMQTAAEHAAANVGLATESVQSGAGNASQVRDFVNQQTPEQLAQNPRYQELLKTNSPEQARSILADELANQSAGSAALWTGLAGKASGAADAFGHTVAGGRVTARQALAGTAKEGIEEALQNPGEDYAKFQAMSQVDPNQTYDFGGSVAQGMVGGIAQGGALHGTGAVSSRLAAPATEVTLAGRPITAYSTDQLQAYSKSGVLTSAVREKVDGELQRRASAEPQAADAEPSAAPAAGPTGEGDQLDSAIQRFAADQGIAGDPGQGTTEQRADAGRGPGDGSVAGTPAAGVQSVPGAPAESSGEPAPAGGRSAEQSAALNQESVGPVPDQEQALERERAALVESAANLAEPGAIRVARQEMAAMEQDRPDDSEAGVRILAKTIQARQKVGYKPALASARRQTADAMADWSARRARLQSTIERNAQAQQATQRIGEIDQRLDELRKNAPAVQDGPDKQYMVMVKDQAPSPYAEDAMREVQSQPAFSRGGQTESAALRELSQHDELFALPKPIQSDVHAIAAEIDPQIHVTQESAHPGTTQRYRVVMPNEGHAWIYVRKPNPYGPTNYGFDLADGEMSAVHLGRPGENAESVDPDKEDVYIDVSKLKPGGSGAKVYAIAAAFAHNSGRVFIGDPAGLSDEALRRRPEQMLSSALKYGTTEHLAPHPRQTVGSTEHNIPPLRWVYGDHVGNIQRLIEHNVKTLDNTDSQARQLQFDANTGQYTNALSGVSGSSPSEELLSGLLHSGGEGTGSGVAPSGRRTLARGAVLRALLREASGEGEAGGGRDGVLARLAGLRNDALPAVDGIFYSRGGEQVGEGAQASHVKRVKELAQSIASAWANGPEVVTVSSMQDLNVPEQVRQLDAAQKSQGASGAPDGFYYGGKVYLVASELHSKADIARVLMHEALGHHGLRGVFGDSLNPILDQLAKLRPDLVEKKAGQYGLDGADERQRRRAAEEVLAELAQTRPNSSYVQRAIAAIRAWLRENIPGLAELHLSDSEIISQYILPARDFVERGRAEGVMQEAPAFSRTKIPPAPNGHLQAEVPEESKAQAGRRIVQDQHIRMRQLREWAEANGAKLSAASDAYAAEERMHGRAASRIEDFREKTIQPLIEQAQKAGFTVDQVAEYLQAQHAEERNQQIAKINPQMPDGGSGMKTADARAILAKSDPKLAAVANKFQAITNQTRDILLKAGIISQDMANAWGAAYKHYVPLKGGDEDAASRTGTGKGLSVNGKTKRAMGHTERDEKVVENILRDHERAIMLAEKNRVGQAMMLWLTEMNDPRIGTVDKPTKRAVLTNQHQFEVRAKNGGVLATFDTEGQARNWITRQVTSKVPGAAALAIKKVVADQTVSYMASPSLEDHEAQAYVNGYAVRMQLNDPLLAQSFKRMNTETLGRLIGLSREINTYLSKAYTGYNPAFIPRNLIRDFGSGVVKITGNFGAGTTAKVLARYPNALGSLLRYSWSNGKSSTPAIDAYRANGGTTGASYLSDIERVGADLKRDYEGYQGALAMFRQGRRAAAVRVAGGKVMHAILQHIEHLNAATENAMRLAVFEQIQKETGSVEQAASAAKNSTVNFNRKGELGGVLGALYLFFNPNVQDTAGVVETLTRGKHKAQAWTILSGMVGMAYALAALQFGGSDDDYDRWKKISDSVRDKNLLLRTGKDSYVTIPVPFGFGFFHTLGNTLFMAQKGEDANALSIGMASNFLDHFSPVGNPLTGAKGWDKIDPNNWLRIAPGAPGTGELGRDAVLSLINKTSFGGDIVPDSKFDEGKPDFLREYRSTKGTLFDKAARGMSDLTGGTTTRGGAIDVSPESLKFWMQNLTGGTGTFLADVVHLAGLGVRSVGATPEEKENLKPELNEWPILRDYAKQERVQDARRAFWDAVSEARSAQLDFKRAVKAGDDAGADKVMSENGELLSLVGLSNSMAKMVKYQRDRVDEINTDSNTSLAYKRGAIRQLEKEETEIYDEFLHDVTQAKASQQAQQRAAK